MFISKNLHCTTVTFTLRIVNRDILDVCILIKKVTLTSKTHINNIHKF
jgi:hypothetical protein